jgi:2-polyprenyl-3-methyl-5-hydroxy-6-metoxy-1,4-benzoquinol methylase
MSIEDASLSGNGTRRREYTEAWGHYDSPSLIDRAGTWLNALQIRRCVGSFAGKRVADIGCGFKATFARSILDEVAHATLVDLSLNAELQRHPKVTAILGELPDVLARLEAHSEDVVVCNNVLEHLWQPSVAIQHMRRILRPGGIAYLNVPSWRGKPLLELAAFRLGLTSAQQIDDHKAYYDPHELWRLVVASGFKPSRVEVRSHKLGLNTVAVCFA